MFKGIFSSSFIFFLVALAIVSQQFVGAAAKPSGDVDHQRMKRAVCDVGKCQRLCEEQNGWRQVVGFALKQALPITSQCIYDINFCQCYLNGIKINQP